MKVDFNLLSFKSKLLVDDRAKTKGFKKLIPAIKADFSKNTDMYDDTLILTTTKTQDEDIFELVSEDGETMANYKCTLSKYAKTLPTETISTRLKNIYELMKIQESFNVIIKALKGYREQLFEEYETLGGFCSSNKENKERLDRLDRILQYLNKDIAYHSKNCKAECDSFELSHGLKESLD